MSSLKVHLLGRFELFDDGGEPLPPPATLNARSLLAYLIVHRLTIKKFLPKQVFRLI